MTVGAFGAIIFEVSASQVETLNNFSYKDSARYATHQRLNNTSLIEYVGMDNATITFNVLLSEYLNTNVQTELDKIEKYEESGEEFHFILGQRFFGSHGGKWVLKSHSVSARRYSKTGKITECEVSLTLEEACEE